MDEYGCCGLEDAEDIAQVLMEDESVVFPFSLDKITSYIVNITPSFKKFGIMPWGGKPDGAFMVSLISQGSFWFSFENELHPGYVGEKLHLGQVDAMAVATMLNAIGQKLE